MKRLQLSRRPVHAAKLALAMACSWPLFALSAPPVAPQVQPAAADIVLRLRVTPQGAQEQVELVHARTGRFAHQPALPTAQDSDLILVARDAAGQELTRQAVRHPSEHQAEVFDPRTGRIAQAASVRREGTIEVRMAWPAQTDRIEVIRRGSPVSRALSADAVSRPLATWQRADLDRQATQGAASDQVRSATAQGLLAQSATAAAVPSGSADLWNSGASSARMDLVLIGDGYTAAEMSKWQADAQKVANGVLADPLFAAYKNSLNIKRVDIASPQSGVSEGGVTRNTALGTVIGCYGIDRLVCADEAKVYAAVGAVAGADARDVIVVVANSTTYGGAGGNIGTMTMHPQSIEVALHEIGHTAFKLADEYDYGTCATSSEPSEANVTIATTKAGAKWGNLIASTTTVPTQAGRYANGTVGLFVGAKYCSSGVYRPTENSRMRTLGNPWHAVNEKRAAEVFAFYNPGGNGGGGNTGGTTVTGNLSGTGAAANVPTAAYQSTQGGTFQLKLSGPAGTNFDLVLYRWNGSAWVVAAQSKSAGSTESITYTGAAGYYYAKVSSVSGAGAYTLTYTFPK